MVGVNLLQNLSSLLLMMLMVRIVSREEMGAYQLIVAAIGIAGMTCLPGLGNAIIQSVARGFAGTYRRAVPLAFGASLLGAAGLLVFALAQVGQARELVFPGAVAAALLFPFSSGLQKWAPVLTGRGAFRHLARQRGVATLVAFGGSAIALWTIEPSIVVVVLVTNLVMAAQNIWMTVRLHRAIAANEPAEEGAIVYGLRTSLYDVVNTLGNHADKVLLFYFLSPEAVAVYAIAERVPELLKNYLQSLRSVFMPAFSRASAYTPAMARQINRVGAGISVAILAIAFLVVPWFVPVMFTQAYADAVLYCQLLLATLVIGQNATLKYTFILSRLDSRGVRDIALSANAVRLLASLLLVPIFGIAGAIAATAVYRITNVAAVSLSLRRFKAAS